MMRGHPVPVGVGDLVVHPGERAPGYPVHQGPGLPAQPRATGLRSGASGAALARSRPAGAAARSGALFLCSRPPARSSPKQGAWQGGQASPGIWAEPCQVRDGDGPPGWRLRVLAEGKQRPVDVEEEQRASRAIGHGRTIRSSAAISGRLLSDSGCG
jgi:hypothetical protein